LDHGGEHHGKLSLGRPEAGISAFKGMRRLVRATMQQAAAGI
jgi:hypothetical protein